MIEENIDIFCDRILNGASLNDKLSCPEKVLLNQYNKANSFPDYPGRPVELAFNRKKSMKLPSVHMLDSARNRGILMHFFLNHELLALEIMAMTLLKFPELPDSFKRGMLKTMREEQDHAKLYIKRMNEMGVELGDVYVNSFFWDCLKDMHSPQQYVTAMSLTFEQANLDFSLFYKKAFEECGDTETAKVMEKVYKDEISHVSFGLKWFRKWKQPHLSDWESYVSGLDFPLSPARAKGNLFDVEGRRKSGLKDSFINTLEVSSFSRGRSPDIYLFNAFTESFIIQPGGFNRPGWGRALEADLSILPIVFCSQDDLLYTYSDNSVDHLKKLKGLGFELPEIRKAEIGQALKVLHKRAPGRLKPWGWSLEMKATLKNFIKQSKCDNTWREQYKELFSKRWSSNFNKGVNESEFSWNENVDGLGVYCESLDEVQKAFNTFSNCDYETICIKSPFGASGRNILRFPKAEISESQLGRVRNLLKKQGGVIVEPWFERVADFSIHFDVQDKLKFVGISRLINDKYGQYSSSLFGKYENGLASEELAFLHSNFKGGLMEFYKKLQPLLEKSIKPYAYKGPVGIDAFIYKGLDGELKFRPVVEVNFRYTMGRVALAMEKKLASGKCGLFKIFSNLSERESETSRNFVELRDKKIILNDQGKWESGYSLLNEWHSEMKFPAVVAVANSFEECLSELS